MPVECPVCRTSNPEGTVACARCNTPIDFVEQDPGATIAIHSETIATQASWASAQPGNKADDAFAPVTLGAVLAGRYELISLLGEGGMGSVYKARDRELDRLVALKLIRPELASNPEILRRFKQEMILARQITHRNVIRIFDLVLAEGRKFITMEYVEGRDLMHQIVAKGKFAAEEALEIWKQALLGLDAAHQEGVVHRDLKPHNIMIDRNGRVCLMDFGVARSIEAAGMTRTGVLMGTPDYMSPEQARGERVDLRSDLFSMGVILYEMVAGVLPYQSSTTMGALVKRTQERAAPLTQLDPEIPEYLSCVVARCLEIDVVNRYQDAAEIVADLEAKHCSAETSSAKKNDGSHPYSLVPGSQFGPRYRIETLLGEGAMGSVYKAYDTELDRSVALKLVRPELGGKAEAMEKLKYELLLASRVSHKHILRIHDLGEADGTKFISMAYVHGQDLRQVMLGEGRLPIPRALKLAKQLCQALEAAHEEGVIHRDLKPENVLVSGDDQACISDFGVATSFVESPVSGTRLEILGTPKYMAPEQVESKRVDGRADLYALGLILYEMVTGDLPFASETSIQAMFQRVTQTPRSPKLLNPELPDDLVAIIMRCLERDPEQRYQNARDILSDLEKVQTGPVPSDGIVHRGAAGSWLFASTVALAVVLAALFTIPQTRHRILDRFSGNATSSVAPRYIAVLPLRITGDDPALGLAADGIVDTLTSRLAQLKAVHLSSPNAAAKINPSDPLRKIARSLGAKLLLRGSVYGDGNAIKVILTLNEPETDKRLWTKEFSGVPQDLLTINDQVYNQLVSALGLDLSGEELARGTSRPTENIGAYDLYLKGRNLLRGKRDEKGLQDALKMFDDALAQDRNFALAYTGVADASLYMYDLKKDGVWTNRALGAAERAQQINDNLPEVHFALGSVYSSTGKTAQGIAELKRALQLAPNSDEAYRRIGRAYLKAGNTVEAVRFFQKAVDSNPYYWLNHNLLGIAYAQSGNNDKALAAFQKVTEVDPARASGWENIGGIYHNQGKWEESVAMFRKAVATQPSAGSYSNLGAGLFFLKRCDEALTFFQKAVELDPDQYLQFGNLAGAYKCLGQQQQASANYEKAVNLALQVLRIDPKDAVTMAHLGTYYAELRDQSRAVEFVRRARTIDSKNPDILYQQAVVYARNDQPKGALEALAQALKQGYSAKEAADDPDLKSLANDPEFRKLTQQK